MKQFDNEFFGFGTETNEDIEQNNFNYDSISGLGESDYENEDLFALEDDFSNDFRISDFEKDGSEDIEPGLKGEEIFNPIEKIEPDVEQQSQVISEPVMNQQTEEVATEKTPLVEKKEIELSETPIEELNKLTEYKEDKIEQTDINSLFNKVSVNVQDASDIFRKNTDLKQKIDTRFEELKKLQSEIENSRKKQIDEINSYKEEVLNKLTEKKAEIEKRLNLLKDTQATLEKEKQEFEQYKKKEQDNIENIQKEVQSAYDDRREELSHIEDVLRKQKDALDEERNQLSLDRIQYEADKNELANNLLKFNDLVNSFKDGVGEIRQ